MLGHWAKGRGWDQNLRRALPENTLDVNALRSGSL